MLAIGEVVLELEVNYLSFDQKGSALLLDGKRIAKEPELYKSYACYSELPQTNSSHR